METVILIRTNKVVAIEDLVAYEVVIPARSYYAMGYIHHNPCSIWYQTDKYKRVVNGVLIVALKKGLKPSYMEERILKIGSVKYKQPISANDIEVEISKIEQLIATGIMSNEIPTAENLEIGWKIFNRELNDSIEEAICAIMCCGRFCAIDRRYFAQKLIDRGVITTRQLVNYTDKLML